MHNPDWSHLRFWGFTSRMGLVDWGRLTLEVASGTLAYLCRFDQLSACSWWCKTWEAERGTSFLLITVATEQSSNSCPHDNTAWCVPKVLVSLGWSSLPDTTDKSRLRKDSPWATESSYTGVWQKLDILIRSEWRGTSHWGILCVCTHVCLHFCSCSSWFFEAGLLIGLESTASWPVSPRESTCSRNLALVLQVRRSLGDQIPIFVLVRKALYQLNYYSDLWRTFEDSDLTGVMCSGVMEG